MAMHLEGAPQESHKDMWDFEERMYEYLRQENPQQLEDLLREPHDLIPGEREAFLWLEENLGRPPRVKLDSSGFRVIPIEEDTEHTS